MWGNVIFGWKTVEHVEISILVQWRLFTSLWWLTFNCYLLEVCTQAYLQSSYQAVDKWLVRLVYWSLHHTSLSIHHFRTLWCWCSSLMSHKFRYVHSSLSHLLLQAVSRLQYEGEKRLYMHAKITRVNPVGLPWIVHNNKLTGRPWLVFLRLYFYFKQPWVG